MATTTAFETAEARHLYILDLFDTHIEDIAALRERCLASVLPSLASSLTLSDQGLARAQHYLADDPVTLFRFLRRWKYDKDAAAVALEKTLTWRLSSDLDLLGASTLEPIYTERSLFFFHPQLKDRFGRPCGILNLKEVRRTEDGSLDGLKEFIAWAWEVARKWLAELSAEAIPGEDAEPDEAEGDERKVPRDGEIEEVGASKNRRKAKVQLSVIVDLKDAGMSNLEMELLPFFMDLLKNHFPGMVGTIFVLHYSWIYSGMWQVAKRILPSQALDRIVFPSSTEELFSFFAPEHLLTQHGGKVDYEYELRTNEIFRRFGRPSYPPVSLSRASSSPALSRRSSFESIHDVFFSAAATPFSSNSRPTTPPSSTSLLQPASSGPPSSSGSVSSRPSWLSMTSLPAAGGGPGLGEAIRRNQRKKGRRRALKPTAPSSSSSLHRTSSALGISLGPPCVEADVSPDECANEDEEDEDALVDDAVGLTRSDSLRDFRLHLPRGTRDLSSGPPSDSSSTTSGGANDASPQILSGSRFSSRQGSRLSSRAVSREPSPRRKYTSPGLPASRSFNAADGDGAAGPLKHERKRDLLRTLSYLAALRVLALNRELRWQLALILSAFEQTFRLGRLYRFGKQMTNATVGRTGLAAAGRKEENKQEESVARRKGVKWVEGEKGDRHSQPRSATSSSFRSLPSTAASTRRRTSIAPSSDCNTEISSTVRAFALFLVFLIVRSTWFTKAVQAIMGAVVAPVKMVASAERKAVAAAATAGVMPTKGGGDGHGKRGFGRKRKRDWWLARAGLR